MAKLFNRAKMTTATTGSGTVTLGSASNGFQTFAAAGVSNGDVVQYVIEEGANFEIGTGTYSSTGTSLTRSPTESSNSNAAITLAGQATVSITAVADDLNRLQHGGSDKVTVSSTGASVTGNLAVSGTVDGRDVASDGSKLDGIESGATGDQTASEIRALVESASDSNVFTDADHSKLNGIEAGATGDQTNAEIRAAVEAATDSNVFTDADHTKLNGIEANAKNDQTITAGGGLTGGGTGDVTISHSDTSSQASVNGSGRTYIQDITLDTYGHVTGLATGTETVVNTNTIPNNATITLSAGGALTGGGNFTTDQSSNETITFNHSDTSSQGSVNNSSGTVIQDVTLDGYGHVTGLASVNLDGRYYTESEADSRFVNVTGDTMTAPLTIDTNTSGMLRLSATNSSPWAIDLQRDDATNSRVYNSGGRWYFEHRPSFVGNTAFDDGYHPNADKWTTARTLSLSGDASGSVSWDGSANATLSVAVVNDSHTHSINTITDEHRLFNNMGDNHGTHTNFNSITEFGARYLKGGTNGPTGTGSHQWYGFTLGLGNEYTGLNSSGDYGSQFYWARQGQGGGAYIWIRDQENGSWGSWRKPYAGKADAWTTARTLSLSGDASGSVSWDGSANVTLSVAVANDSHTHDGRYYTESESNTRFAQKNTSTRQDFTGSIKVSSNNTTGGGIVLADDGDIVDLNDGYASMRFSYGVRVFSANGSGSVRHTLHSNGTFTSTGNINSQSDIRVKENIEPISDAMQKVQSINGVTFNRNDLDDTETRYVGVIAQDVEAVLPEAVSENDEGIKQVAYGNMVGLLIEAIKEQQTQIDDLKAEIQSMKS